MPKLHPILYSFRRCPYAIRARLAISSNKLEVELREVILKDKPAEMLSMSTKGTVPVLVLPHGKVIDESLEIMYWALQKNDPNDWLLKNHPKKQQQIKSLILENDHVFKPNLDRYKYFDRHPEQPQEYYRELCETTLNELEQRLQKSSYLIAEQISLADIAIFPFVRQFAHVDRNWFYSSRFTSVQKWLDQLMQSPNFTRVMLKYPQWHSGDIATIFPSELPSQSCARKETLNH